jgi:hypothetical protein
MKLRVTQQFGKSKCSPIVRYSAPTDLLRPTIRERSALRGQGFFLDPLA